MIIKEMNINDLRPADYNPRKDLTPDDPEYIKLKRSIMTYGYIEPIVFNERTGTIVGGHQRLKILEDLGYNEVTVSVIDVSEEEEKALNIALNKIEGDWDNARLKDLLEELDTGSFDMELTGFDFEELEDLMTQFHVEDEPEDADAEEDDFDVEEALPETARTKRGDIYRLGRHVLKCGDSTNDNDIRALMGGKVADLVFTDPPYGMKKEKDGVLNDNLNFDDLLEFNKKWIPLAFEMLKDNGSFYCWGMDEPLMDIYSEILKPMIRDDRITFRNLITWNKEHGQGQKSEEYRMYAIADEKCLFVMNGGKSTQEFSVNQEYYDEELEEVRHYLDTEIKKLNQSDKEIANALGYKDGRTVNHWRSKSQFALPTRANYEALKSYGQRVLQHDDFLAMEYDDLREQYDEFKTEFYNRRSYFNNTHDNMNNVWTYERAASEERVGHATPKPIKLCSRAIKSSSRENELVLDLFGGGGSTLIACEQLNRVCYMMELDERYCDVIIERWEQLTGEKAELIESQKIGG